MILNNSKILKYNKILVEIFYLNDNSLTICKVNNDNDLKLGRTLLFPPIKKHELHLSKIYEKHLNSNENEIDELNELTKNINYNFKNSYYTITFKNHYNDDQILILSCPIKEQFDNWKSILIRLFPSNKLSKYNDLIHYDGLGISFPKPTNEQEIDNTNENLNRNSDLPSSTSTSSLRKSTTFKKLDIIDDSSLGEAESSCSNSNSNNSMDNSTDNTSFEENQSYSNGNSKNLSIPIINKKSSSSSNSNSSSNKRKSLFSTSKLRSSISKTNKNDKDNKTSKNEKENKRDSSNLSNLNEKNDSLISQPKSKFIFNPPNLNSSSTNINEKSLKSSSKSPFLRFKGYFSKPIIDKNKNKDKINDKINNDKNRDKYQTTPAIPIINNFKDNYKIERTRSLSIQNSYNHISNQEIYTSTKKSPLFDLNLNLISSKQSKNNEVKPQIQSQFSSSESSSSSSSKNNSDLIYDSDSETDFGIGLNDIESDSDFDGFDFEQKDETILEINNKSTIQTQTQIKNKNNSKNELEIGYSNPIDSDISISKRFNLNSKGQIYSKPLHSKSVDLLQWSNQPQLQLQPQLSKQQQISSYNNNLNSKNSILMYTRPNTTHIITPTTKQQELLNSIINKNNNDSSRNGSGINNRSIIMSNTTITSMETVTPNGINSTNSTIRFKSPFSSDTFILKDDDYEIRNNSHVNSNVNVNNNVNNNINVKINREKALPLTPKQEGSSMIPPSLSVPASRLRSFSSDFNSMGSIKSRIAKEAAATTTTNSNFQSRRPSQLQHVSINTDRNPSIDLQKNKIMTTDKGTQSLSLIANFESDTDDEIENENSDHSFLNDTDDEDYDNNNNYIYKSALSFPNYSKHVDYNVINEDDNENNKNVYYESNQIGSKISIHKNVNELKSKSKSQFEFDLFESAIDIPRTINEDIIKNNDFNDSFINNNNDENKNKNHSSLCQEQQSDEDEIEETNSFIGQVDNVLYTQKASVSIWNNLNNKWDKLSDEDLKIDVCFINGLYGIVNVYDAENNKTIIKNKNKNSNKNEKENDNDDEFEPLLSFNINNVTFRKSNAVDIQLKFLKINSNLLTTTTATNDKNFEMTMIRCSSSRQADNLLKYFSHIQKLTTNINNDFNLNIIDNNLTTVLNGSIKAGSIYVPSIQSSNTNTNTNSFDSRQLQQQQQQSRFMARSIVSSPNTSSNSNTNSFRKSKLDDTSPSIISRPVTLQQQLKLNEELIVVSKQKLTLYKFEDEDDEINIYNGDDYNSDFDINYDNSQNNNTENGNGSGNGNLNEKVLKAKMIECDCFAQLSIFAMNLPFLKRLIIENDFNNEIIYDEIINTTMVEKKGKKILIKKINWEEFERLGKNIYEYAMEFKKSKETCLIYEVIQCE